MKSKSAIKASEIILLYIISLGIITACNTVQPINNEKNITNSIIPIENQTIKTSKPISDNSNSISVNTISVNIIKPSSASSFYSNKEYINLSGTSKDINIITKVIVSSNTGITKNAIGTTSWSSKNFKLVLGTNIITITAFNANNKKSIATAVIIYKPKLAKKITSEIPTKQGKNDLFRYPYIQSDKTTSITILWATKSNANGILQIWNNNTQTWKDYVSKTTLFTSSQTKLKLDFTQHQVELNNLLPNTRYLYNIVQNKIALAKNIQFKTLPDKSNPVNFIIFGDSGTEYSQPRSVRNSIIEKQDGNLKYPHDFIIAVGDIAYSRGSYKEFNRKFFNQLSAKGDKHNGNQSILSTRPFFASLGNHEYGNKDTRIPEAYLQAFTLPINSTIPKSDQERYYSFDSGPAHFIVLDTMKFSGQKIRLDSMLEWLENDLSSSMKKWKLVFFHHSVFSNGPHGTWGDRRENRLIRKLLLPILQQYNVKLVVYGHDHFYQRNLPLRVDSSGKIIRDSDDKIINKNGITYVLNGNGGADLHKRSTQPSSPGTNLWYKQIEKYGEAYDFVAYRNNEPVLFDNKGDSPLKPIRRWGFSHVTITNKLLTFTAYNSKGEMLDQFTITP